MQQSLEQKREKTLGHFFAVIISLSENLKKSSCNSAIFQDFWKFNAKMGEFLCPHLETWLVHWVQNLRRRKTESYLKRKKKKSCSMHLGKRSRKMERHGNTRLRTPLKSTVLKNCPPENVPFDFKNYDTLEYLITAQHLSNLHNGKLPFIWLAKEDKLIL